MKDDILIIVRDNLRNLMNMNEINSFRELAIYTGISADTIRKWYKNGGVQPRISTRILYVILFPDIHQIYF